MPLEAFPIVYAADVGRSVRFYEQLGFEQHFRHPSDGEPGYVGLRRGVSELGVVTAQSPKQILGVATGAEPRFEHFVYVDDVDAELDALQTAGMHILREPQNMPCGERLGYAADPDGNPVALAAPTAAS